MQLEDIDHIHVYVKNREQAETWCKRVLALTRVESFEVWADGGPLTLGSGNGQVHLALFETNTRERSNVAFKVSGAMFPGWLKHLAANAIEFQLKDHDLAWSVYFDDPDGNHYEITCYDYAEVAKQISANE